MSPVILVLYSIQGVKMREAIILIVIAVIFSSTAFAQSGRITVDISGIKNIEGQIAIGLFKNADGFPEISKAYKGTFLEVAEKTIQYTFFGIQNGDYAIAVFHDSNNNSKLDKNFIGIPKEGYGFSKNANMGTFGPPNFDQAKFKLDEIYPAKIKLRY